MFKAVPPIVHANGSSKEALLLYRYDAIDALVTAGEILSQVRPNGRDYYPKPGLMAEAEAANTQRLVALLHIIDALEEEIVAIQDQ